MLAAPKLYNMVILPSEFNAIVEKFKKGGYELYLVGGSLRDNILGVESDDYDFTTDALPEKILELVKDEASQVWTAGQRYGTIAFKLGKFKYEITTHRQELYNDTSRKPEVLFSGHLLSDLSRRDFTINTLAFRLGSGELVDPFGGLVDLGNRVLRTPGKAEDSFYDDPLRIFRAARFISKFQLEPTEELIAAAKKTSSLISKVSIERVNVEFTKLLELPDCEKGFSFLLNTEVLPILCSEISWPQGARGDRLALRLNTAPQVLALRLAVMLIELKKENEVDPGAFMKSFKYDNSTTKLVTTYCENFLPQKIKSSTSIRDVREYIYTNKKFLNEQIQLAQIFQQGEDSVERVRDVVEKEGLDSFSLAVSGADLVRKFSISPSPEVGKILEYAKEVRLKKGPVSKERILEEVKEVFKL